MTEMLRTIGLDTATGLSRGRRALQEDAVIGHVEDGAAEGLIALADGCGGHARGDLASNIAAEVALRAFRRSEGTVPARLREAAEAANLAVYAKAQTAPDLEGMSTTLLLAHVDGPEIHWVSVGDSPLYLLRAGRLERLNATHSLARHLDILVDMGEMAPEEAAGHPARATLTSALGGAEIEEIDCPEEPVEAGPGDVLMAASDGLLTLPERAIAQLLSDGEASAATLVDRLLDAVAEAGADEQDNTSVAVVRLSPLRLEPVRARPSATLAGLRRRALAVLSGAMGAGAGEAGRSRSRG
jgi:serine/threonine protein phosphatase PrpC